MNQVIDSKTSNLIITEDALLFPMQMEPSKSSILELRKMVQRYLYQVSMRLFSLFINRHTGPVWQTSWAHPQFGGLLASCGYDRRVGFKYKATDRNMERSSSKRMGSSH